MRENIKIFILETKYWIKVCSVDSLLGQQETWLEKGGDYAKKIYDLHSSLHWSQISK